MYKIQTKLPTIKWLTYALIVVLPFATNVVIATDSTADNANQQIFARSAKKLLCINRNTVTCKDDL